MAPIVVIGSTLETAGFRLAGLEVHTPAPAALPAVWAQALAEAQLVVLGHHAAAALPPGVLAQAQRRETPLVAVLPDLAAPAPDADFVHRMRALLGIDA